MGFYGNIADTTRIHFQFDKIFSSRAAMDRAVQDGTDDVFSGRFVLVQYDPHGEYTGMELATGFKQREVSGKYVFSLDAAGTVPYGYTGPMTQVDSPVIADWDKYYIQYTNTTLNSTYYYKLQSRNQFKSTETYWTYTYNTQLNKVFLGQVIRSRDFDTGSIKEEYWKCTGQTSSISSLGTHVALFSLLSSSVSMSTYLTNYQEDKDTYGISIGSSDDAFDIRGYDGTVWQKVYSGGQGQFVLIARLTATFPKVTLSADVPSTFPSIPRIIDYDGTQMQLSVPTHWGFRVREVGDLENSDQDIVQSYKVYDGEGRYQRTESRQIRADIYFNKKAQQKLYDYYEDNGVNEIQITPDGESGAVYTDPSGGSTLPDTYQLSVHLPMIGNVVAEGYNLIYGKTNITNTDGAFMRPTDIAWYSGDTSEIVKQQGDGGQGGKSHDLDTLAGTLNTFHDRLGQIIVPIATPISDVQANSLNDQYIYALPNVDGTSYTYYRIGVDYDYELVPNNKISYIPATITADTYEPDTYYTKSGSSYNVATSSDFSTYSGQQLYKKSIENITYTRIVLIQYNENTYFYKDTNNNYIKDSHANTPTYKNRPYYNITSANERVFHFDCEYAANEYYKTDPDYPTHYIKASETIPDPTVTYYDIDITSISNNSAQILFQPNKYYYYSSYDSNGQPVGNPIPATESQIVSGRTYWYIPLSDEITVVPTQDGLVVGYALDIDHKQNFTNRLFSPTGVSMDSIYIELDNALVPVSEVPDLTVAYKYYTLTIAQLGNYFLPNEYYTKNSGSYYLAATWSHNSSTNYYKLINVTALEHPFYEKDKYYFYNGTQYVIDHGTTPSHNVATDYYTITALYVYSDETQRWPVGFQWRSQSLFVPASVTLATRTEVKRALEISGINNGQSSINGSILTFNSLSGIGSDGIRDTSTLMGSLNAMNDLLTSIKQNLLPGKILYLNDFGQIATSSVDIADLERLVNS